AVHDVTGAAPRITFNHGGKPQEVTCDFVGGCDGFHGVCRPTIPDGVLTRYDREYPFGWVGILSESPPADDQLFYSYQGRAFALSPRRSSGPARLFFQCAYHKGTSNWRDRRIWEELHAGLGGPRPLAEGKIVDKLLTAMHSFVVEPMQYGRLFLA